MLIISPNIGFDHTVRLAELRAGQVIRTGPATTLAGGKGANVARAALRLGAEVTVIGFLASGGRERLRELFADECLPLDGVEVPGMVRTCTVLIEDGTNQIGGRVTLLNEPGPMVDQADWARLGSLVGRTVTPGDRLVCSGSLPPGSPDDAYAVLVALAHRAGAEVAVDVGGPALALAVQAGADLVSPNLAEAEGLLNGSASEEIDERGDDIPDRAVRAAAALRQAGARQAVVTAGACGIALADQTGLHWLPTIAVRVRNPIGAGDSFLAGTMVGRERGLDWRAAVLRGAATASASVEQAGAGVVDPRRVDELADALRYADRR